MSTLLLVKEKLAAAKCPEDVFGALVAPKDPPAAFRALWRPLVRAVHPDYHPDEEALAEELLVAVNYWKGEGERKIVAGTYGDRRPPAPSYKPVELTVRGKRIRLVGLLSEGTFSTVHRAEAEGDPDAAFFVKIAREPANNDLLEREFTTLRKLTTPHVQPEVEEFAAKQRSYVPRPVSSFFVQGPDGAQHRANLLAVPAGSCYTIEALRARFPGGLEAAHVYWIFRRLLLTLWLAHLHGLVHGAVTPDHVLVYDELHGIVLLDWTCAAAIETEHVPAYDPQWEKLLPLELLVKGAAAPQMDLYMAARTALYLLGDEVIPAAVRQVLEKATAENLLRRPSDAEQYYTEFGQIIEAAHGRRRFAALKVPR